jgi:hypothetical protein
VVPATVLEAERFNTDPDVAQIGDAAAVTVADGFGCTVINIGAENVVQTPEAT